MRTTEERLQLLHQRAEALGRRKAKGALVALGGLTGGLLALLLALEGPFASHSAFSGQFSGASLLTDSVGSYVLAAVIAFTVGVGLTVGISRYREKKQAKNKDSE